MASKVQQVQRFINFISKQLETLKEERKNVIDTVDDAVNQVQIEVEAWVNGGSINESTCARMNNRIQQVITSFMARTVAISDPEFQGEESDRNQMSSASSYDSTSPRMSHTREEPQEKMMLNREKTLPNTGVDTPHITAMRFAILEEAVFSLKKTTEQSQEKQENVKKKLEILTNENMQIKKHFQETLTALEKLNQHISSNIGVKLNRLDEENKCLNVSMNESVENINQSYDKMSNKMNQLEISINLMSSQYTEQFENMSSLNKDNVDDLVGMVCQLLSKRLAPLETLHETLNKKFILSREHISKIKAIETDLAKISERKFNKPNVGFHACKMFDFTLGTILIDKYDEVPTNYGIHFNQSSGKFTAPLNGFYLIIIHVKRFEESKNGSFSIKCIQRMKNPSSFCRDDSRHLCCVSNNASETLLFELTAGDILDLEAVTQGKKLSGLSRIEFACCLIK